MEIKGVSNNNILPLHETIKQNVVQSDIKKKSDKLEISNEARVLQTTNKNKDLTLIQARIKSNYYNSDEVISHTANAILRQMNIR